MAANQFNVGEVVYLRQSAALGFLEAYKIGSIIKDTSDTWGYIFQVNAAAPHGIPTIGDRINYKVAYSVIYAESELLSYCEALLMAKAHHERQLAALNSKIAAVDCE